MSGPRLIVGPFNRVEGDLEVTLDIADGRVASARDRQAESALREVGECLEQQRQALVLPEGAQEEQVQRPLAVPRPRNTTVGVDGERNRMNPLR